MPLRIRPFAPGDEQAFRTLNETWIMRYFEMEAPGHAILNDPRGAILDPGGHILMADLDGARRLHLETNSVLAAAIRLYESAGFTGVETNSEFRRADVAMELILK